MATPLKKSQFLIKDYLFSFAIIIVGIFSRIIPHMPNFSPEIIFAMYLGVQLNKLWTCIAVFLMVFLSDTILSFQYGYHIIGSWSFFTYSALIIIGLIGTGRWVKSSGAKFLIGGLVLTSGYWGWTNFGVWLLSDMYPHNLNGISSCYLLALPFLKTSLESSLIWVLVILAYEYSLNYFRIRKIPLLIDSM